MASVFRNAQPSKNHHAYPNAHMMNLALRTGESATLYYRPRGRYLLTTIRPADVGIEYKNYYTLGPVRKGSLAWTDQPPAAYGNGLIEYKPDLRSEVFRFENKITGVAAKRERRQPELAAERAGETASVVLEMSSPWVVVGKQNDLTDFDDDTDGAVVGGLFWRNDEEDENRIYVSTDAGRSWTKVWENRFRGAVPFRVDVTKYAKGRYSYWLKFEWVDNGVRGAAGLEKLGVETWVALSPMALPRLEAGKNSFTLATGTVRTIYHESRWDKGERLAGEKSDNLAASEKAPYLRPAEGGAGSLEFALAAPGDLEETRISVLLRALGKMADVTLALSASADDGATWSELRKFAPDPEHDTNHMWFNHVITEGLHGANTRFKLTVSGAGFEKVIANSAVREKPRTANTLRITHSWFEGDERKTFTRSLPPGSPRSYQFVAGEGLKNDALRFEAAAP
jgi:hypothetical protein